MYRSETGFTLIELIISISILVVLATVGTLSLFQFREANYLRSSQTELVSLLRDAQERSLTEDSGVRWGVRLVNAASGSDYAILINGDDIESEDTVLPQSATVVGGFIFLKRGIEFSNPTDIKDIVFAKGSGQRIPSGQSTIVIRIIDSVDPEDEKTISIDSVGLISY